MELKRALSDLAEAHRLQAQIVNIASMYQIFFTPEPVNDYAGAKQANTAMFTSYFRELLRQGIFIPPSQFESCFLSTAHKPEDLTATISAFDKALGKAAEEKK